MSMIEPALAAGIIPAIEKFVTVTKLHPILVNFTAALVPVSVVSDLAARLRKDEQLRHTAWWSLLLAAIITPFTAMTGWLFWMSDDNGVAGMTVHKWLGTGLALLLLGQLVWRFKMNRRREWASLPYLIVGLLLVAALVIQGYFGGEQVFSGM